MLPLTALAAASSLRLRTRNRRKEGRAPKSETGGGRVGSTGRGDSGNEGVAGNLLVVKVLQGQDFNSLGLKFVTRDSTSDSNSPVAWYRWRPSDRRDISLKTLYW